MLDIHITTLSIHLPQKYFLQYYNHGKRMFSGWAEISTLEG